MKRLPYITMFLALFVVAGLISGCQESEKVSGAYIDPSLVVPVEMIRSEDVVVSKAEAHIEGQVTKIIGKVKRTPNNCCATAKGHVDIVVVAEDGVVLDTESVLFKPRNITKTGTKSAKFKATLPYIVPEGAVLRLTYHDSLDAADKNAYAGALFQCEHNMAIPEEQTAIVLP